MQKYIIFEWFVVYKTYLKDEAEHIKFHIGGTSNKSM